MKIIITGPKCSGKSTIGAEAAKRLEIPFYETDSIIEELYSREHNEKLNFYEICEKLGETAFREYEKRAVKEASELDWCIISVGGSTLLDSESRRLLRDDSVIVLLKADLGILWERLKKRGSSVYFKRRSPEDYFKEAASKKIETLEPFADITIDVSDDNDNPGKFISAASDYFAMLSKSPNTSGQIIRATTFGESHGPAVGVVLDGLKPGIEFSAEDIQAELERRRPGQSSVSTPRSEKDKVRILSGVFEGKTTGTPIAMIIENKDQDSTKYDIIKHLFRPGHADFTFWKKYGIRDHKGGGRSSGRETAGRVASGAAAKKILADRGVKITASSFEIGGVKAEEYNPNEIESNPVRCADKQAAEKMQQAILEARKNGDSLGGIVELRISGVPAGLGDPVFGKLDARLAGALFSLGAVKGLSFGDGFEAAKSRGSEFNDQMRDNDFLSNHAGGVLGGISTGQDILVSLAVKPTPSISQPQDTVNTEGSSKKIQIEGRHDPCILPRIIPVVEAMAALVLLDCWEIQQRLRPGTI
ncbi:Chorismate synthase [Sedimentisphaera cyanobacteriorum]|uniref:Multifunctional fusion protein n=1 Tax=Sedimentisphaera cyanobacteriorum TaxID=1940790 RepID=A0A1Q2HMU7_9BACT|nr:chorismate synthase [Sedimentisphaera cyanobacteriorum]AQQ08762.1 Chorismate synthase [Sedimentisphaera cyanobacteriorum]